MEELLNEANPELVKLLCSDYYKIVPNQDFEEQLNEYILYNLDKLPYEELISFIRPNISVDTLLKIAITNYTWESLSHILKAILDTQKMFKYFIDENKIEDFKAKNKIIEVKHTSGTYYLKKC